MYIKINIRIKRHLVICKYIIGCFLLYAQEKNMEYRYDIALSFATENIDLVEKVYHYLRAAGCNPFFAPDMDAQTYLTGRNQSEAFYEIFGLKSKWIALFVSKDYIKKKLPMEEAAISFATHGEKGMVIPIYLDNSKLPTDMLNPDERNYFESNDAAQIANHLIRKVGRCIQNEKRSGNMIIENNSAVNQTFIQSFHGGIIL